MNTAAFNTAAFNSAPPSPTSLTARAGNLAPSKPVLQGVSATFAAEGALKADVIVQSAKKDSPRGRARTAIGRAVLKNRVAIDLVAASFLILIDERLETLRQEPPNSAEATAAVDAAIADYDDLKRRVEAFLGVTAQFAVKNAKETTVIEKTNFLAAGFRDCWSKRHVQICDRAFDKALKAVDVALFGIGVGICSLAGADANWAVAIPGAMVGGKNVVDAIRAAKCLHTKTG